MATAGSPRPSTPTRERHTGARPASTPPGEQLPPIVGLNLRRLRSKRGLSLERLSQRAGVSRAMLSQIELGRSVPTINLLWKISRALGVTFATFLSEQPARLPVVLSARTGKLLTNREGTFTSRALFPLDGPRRSEFYELRLSPGVEEHGRPHPPDTCENVVVASGSIEIGVEQTVYTLATGDALLYPADQPHFYRNAGSVETVLYLVVTHDGPAG